VNGFDLSGPFPPYHGYLEAKATESEAEEDFRQESHEEAEQAGDSREDTNKKPADDGEERGKGRVARPEQATDPRDEEEQEDELDQAVDNARDERNELLNAA